MSDDEAPKQQRPAAYPGFGSIAGAVVKPAPGQDLVTAYEQRMARERAMSWVHASDGPEGEREAMLQAMGRAYDHRI